MRKQVQFLEVKLAVPSGYQAVGYDFVEPMGLYLSDDGRAVRNLTMCKSRRKFITLKLVEIKPPPTCEERFSAVGY